MNIKIHPVRWWRSDADRYKPRGAYMAPEQPDQANAAQWAIELLLPPDPETIALFERLNREHRDALMSFAVPIGLLFQSCSAERVIRERLLLPASTPRSETDSPD